MSEEIDVGGVVATVRIDSEKADNTLNNVIQTINRFGSALESTIAVVDNITKQTNALSPILDRVGTGVDTTANAVDELGDKADNTGNKIYSLSDGIHDTAEVTADAQKSVKSLAEGMKNIGDSSASIKAAASDIKKVDSSASAASKSIGKANAAMSADTVKKFDDKLVSLNADYKKQSELVLNLSARLDNLVDDFYRLSEAMGNTEDFDPSKIYPAESAELDKEFAKLTEIENKIKEVTAAREKAAQAAVDSAAKSAAAAQSAANAENKAAKAVKEQANSTKAANMAFDTGATALRAVTSAAGGTVSQLGYLGTELIYLKRNMQAAATTGAMMASVLSFGVMAAVTLVSAGISAMQEKEEKRKQAFEDGVQNLEKYSSELQTLKQSLDVLNNTKSSTDQLTTARNNLASTFDDLIVGYTDEGEAILANNELMEKQIELINRKISLTRQEIIANSEAIEKYNAIRQEIKAAQTGGDLYAFNVLNDQQLLEYDIQIIEYYQQAQKEVKAYIQENINLIDSNTGVALSWEQLSAAQSTMGNTLILEYMDDIINKNITFEEVLEDIRNKLSDSDYIATYYTNLNNQVQNAVNNTKKFEDAFKKLEDSYGGLNSAISKSVSAMSEVQSDMASAYVELTENGKLAQSTVNSLISSYPQLIDYLDAETGQLNLTEDIMRDLYEIQKQLRIAELEAAKEKLKTNEELIKSNLKVAQSVYEIAKAAKELKALENSYSRIDTLIENLNNMQLDFTVDVGYSSSSSGISEYSKALEKLNHQKRMGQLTTQKEIVALEELGRKYSLTADEQMDLEYRLYTAKKQYADEIEAARSRALRDQYTQIENLKRMGQLTTQEEIAALEELGRKYSLTADEQMDLEYRLYTAKKQHADEIEASRAKALQDQYTQMENLKSLGKLTSEQELAWLEKIRQKYKMNAEERIALEIKIYNLKQELQQNEISALDDLGTAITEALKNQYDKQRKAEQDRINESIAAWDEWEKSTIAAIQAEIDALDKLEKEQESQSKAAEYYQKSQELQLLIAYEKDGYLRKQYQKELNRLNKEEQERLRKEQLQAKKEELQMQMDTVSDTANARRAALEAELDVINENYDKLTSALSLRAQTEKIIMQQSQEDIISLIMSYAPEYNLTGQSIGESLYNGFKSKVDAIYDYVEKVMSAIINYQNTAKRIAAEAADSFETAYKNNQAALASSTSTIINYTSNFNVPVESPVQTKRAIESTAASIAALIK